MTMCANVPQAPVSRRIITVSLACFMAALACQAAVDVMFPASAPLATPTPCAGSGIVFSQRIQDVLVNSYCGVNDLQASQVAEYARYGLERMPTGIDPSLTMFVFTDLDKGVDLELQWRDSLDYEPVSRERLLEDWKEYSGRAYEDGIFVLLENGMGSGSRSARVAHIVLHELHHVAQFRLRHAYSADADWLSEGGADAIADRQMVGLGFAEASYWHPAEPGCDFPLSKLQHRTADIPLDCIYGEGEKAVSLLIDQCGEAAYYQLFREALAGRSLSTIFQRVYLFALADFYAGFEEYRQSGYSATPLLCSEPISINVTSTPDK